MNLAVDVGGTNLRAEVYKELACVDSLNAKSSEIGLCSWIESILEKYKEIKTIGIAYAGQVEDGYIISAPNIDIDKKDIKNYFESKYDVSLKIENDLTCAVIAEAKLHESENISALYVGTGLGLGVVESAKVLRGSHNMAAELGHIPYKEAPFSCGCGRFNCLELYSSGSGLQKWVKYKALTCKSTLDDLKSSQNRDIVDMFEEALLYAVGNVISIFNPEVLVLGGGIISSNPYLLDFINQHVDKYALPGALKNVKICISSIDDAPLRGALLLKDYNG